MHEKLGTKMTHVSAYNAKANSVAETMVKQLKSMLRAYEVQGLKWWKVLAACERNYNDSVNSAIGFTPFYMNFGRHPYQHVGTILEPLEEQFVTEFCAEIVAQQQAELGRIHGLAAERLQERLVKETARRNEKRNPTLDYHVDDYVYLETSAIKKSHSLAPLRSGPFKVTKITANGNAVYLEGFRHPFNVEILTPTLCYSDGRQSHLTQHDLDHEVVVPAAFHLPLNEAHAVGEPEPEVDPALIDIETKHEGVVQELLDENDVPEPIVRIVPSSNTGSRDIVRIPAEDPEVSPGLGILTHPQQVGSDVEPNGGLEPAPLEKSLK
jgi:hypothetical protein